MDAGAWRRRWSCEAVGSQVAGRSGGDGGWLEEEDGGEIRQKRRGEKHKLPGGEKEAGMVVDWSP